MKVKEMFNELVCKGDKIKVMGTNDQQAGKEKPGA